MRLKRFRNFFLRQCAKCAKSGVREQVLARPSTLTRDDFELHPGMAACDHADPLSSGA